jgi:hypothetical protein
MHTVIRKNKIERNFKMARAQEKSQSVPEGQRATSRLQDIPDTQKKEPPKADMPPHVQAEREVRRFIRKDGVFVKDFERLFDRFTGEIKNGKCIYAATMSLAEAKRHVIELLEKTGRKIEHDPLTGRPKAVPGWDLNISVPGMEQSEQRAPVESDQVIRDRQNAQLIADQRKMIDELSEQLSDMAAKIELMSGQPEEQTKDKDKTKNKK